MITTYYFDEQLAADLTFAPPPVQAEYRFDEGSGTTLVDHSGNGYNGTLGGALGPSWYPAWDATGLVFNAHGQVGIPDAAVAGAKAILIVASPTQGALINQGALVSTNAGGQPVDLGFAGGDQRFGQYVHLAYGDAAPAGAIPFRGNAGVFAINLDGGTYLNGQRVPLDAIDAHTFPPLPDWSGATGGMVGAHYFGGNTGLVGKIHYLRIYSDYLTPAQVLIESQAAQAIVAARGVSFANQTTFTDDLILFAGDSMTRGYNATLWANSYAAQAVGALASRPATLVNLAVSGDGSTEMITYTRLFRDVAQLFTGRKVCVYMIGTNGDWQAGILTDLASFYSGMKDLGFDDVIAVQGLPRYPDDSPRAAFNAALEAGIGVYADAVSLWAHSLVMGQAGQYSNPTYYADGLHPNSTGHGIGAGYLSTALASRGYT